MTAVTAVDSNDTMNNGVSEVVSAGESTSVRDMNSEECVNEPVLYTSESSDDFNMLIVSVSGDSFSDIRSAVEDANDGDTIALSSSNYKSDGKVINIKTNNLIIKGSSKSKAVLDVKNADARAFIINGKNVRLENLIFKNMDSDKYGIVRVNSTKCNIVNCEFIDNTGNVGGILINDDADYTTVQNCIFTNNNAKYGEDTRRLGGAIDSHASYTKITNSKFTNNNADNKGGAIYLTRGQNNIIDDCVFTNNVAESGGAIYIVSTSDANITNSNFTNNKADNGGAIYNNGITEVSNCNFNNNEATSNGGAIYNAQQLSINQSIFVNNKAFVKITTSVPKYVNCSNNAIITAKFNSGNNILDAIWSNTQITNNGISLNPSYSDKNLVLSINGKKFTAKTNSDGVATFKFNTKGFSIKTHKGSVSHSANGKTDSSNLNLIITKKKEVFNKLKRFKTKKKKIYKAYKRVYEANVPVKKWNKVKKKHFKTKYKWYKQGYSKQKTKFYKGKIITN